MIPVPSVSELLAIRTGRPETEFRNIDGERREWRSQFITTPTSTRVEARAESRDDEDMQQLPDCQLRLVGYSAVFDSDSELLYGFVREQIKRGAFKNVLKQNPDVRLLENHEGRPHARTTNGTLVLEERPRGLYRNAVLDERRQDSRDLYYGVDRGDYSQSSFAFTIKRSEWRYCECVDAATEDDPYMGCDCEWERDILEVGSLLDDSVVTYPAYPETTVMVARESEPSGERNAQAIDEEQRDTATDLDASTPRIGGDLRHHAMRTRIARLRSTNHVSGTDRGASSRH